MSRLQLALRVPDLESSIAFYTTLFRTEPAKRRPGYANFAITEPPLKLVLIEHTSEDTTRLDGQRRSRHPREGRPLLVLHAPPRRLRRTRHGRAPCRRHLLTDPNTRAGRHRAAIPVPTGLT